MFKEVERFVKRVLKKKVRVVTATVIAFLLTGCGGGGGGGDSSGENPIAKDSNLTLNEGEIILDNEKKVGQYSDGTSQQIVNNGSIFSSETKGKIASGVAQLGKSKQRVFNFGLIDVKANYSVGQKTTGSSNAHNFYYIEGNSDELSIGQLAEDSSVVNNGGVIQNKSEVTAIGQHLTDKSIGYTKGMISSYVNGKREAISYGQYIEGEAKGFNSYDASYGGGVINNFSYTTDLNAKNTSVGQYVKDKGEASNLGFIKNETHTLNENGVSIGQYIGGKDAKADNSYRIENKTVFKGDKSAEVSSYGQYNEGGLATNSVTSGDDGIIENKVENDSKVLITANVYGQFAKNKGVNRNSGVISFTENSLIKSGTGDIRGNFVGQTSLSGSKSYNTGTISSNVNNLKEIAILGQRAEGKSSEAINSKDIELVHKWGKGKTTIIGQEAKSEGKITNDGNIKIINNYIGVDDLTIYGQNVEGSGSEGINNSQIYLDLEDGDGIAQRVSEFGKVTNNGTLNLISRGEGLDNKTLIGINTVGIETSSLCLVQETLGINNKNSSIFGFTEGGEGLKLSIGNKVIGMQAEKRGAKVINSGDINLVTNRSSVYGQIAKEGAQAENNGIIMAEFDDYAYDDSGNPETLHINAMAVGQLAEAGSTVTNNGKIYVNRTGARNVVSRPIFLKDASKWMKVRDIGIYAKGEGATGINKGIIEVYNHGEEGTWLNNTKNVEGIAIGMLADGQGAEIKNYGTILIDSSAKGAQIELNETSGGTAIEGSVMQEINGGKAYNYGTIEVSALNAPVGIKERVPRTLASLKETRDWKLDKHSASTTAKYSAPKISIGENLKIMAEEGKGNSYRVEDFVFNSEKVKGVENLNGDHGLYKVKANLDELGNVDLVLTRNHEKSMGDILSGSSKKIADSLNITDAVLGKGSYLNKEDEKVSTLLMKSYYERTLGTLLKNSFSSNIYANLNESILNISEDLVETNSDTIFAIENSFQTEMVGKDEFNTKGIIPNIASIGGWNLGLSAKYSVTEEDDTTGHRVTYDRKEAIVGFGLSRQDGSVKRGMALGYSRNELDFDKNKGEGTIDSYNLLYGIDNKSKLFDMKYYLGTGVNLHDYTRKATLGNIERDAKSKFNSYTVSAGVEISKEFEFDRFRFRPLAGLDMTYLIKESFDEKGAGSLNIQTGEKELYSIKPKVGLESEISLFRNDFHEISFDSIVEYGYELGNIEDEKEKIQFEGFTGSYELANGVLEDYNLSAEASLKYRYRDNLEVSGGYQYKNTDDGRVKVGLKYSW